MTTLLEKRLTQDRDAKAQAEKKVEEMTSLRPSDEESRKVNEIITAMSKLFAERIAEEGITEAVKAAISNQVDKEVSALEGDYENRSRIRKLVMTSMFGLGPLERFLRPGSTATDIVVQRYDCICVEDDTGMHKVQAEFNSEAHLRNVIQRIVQDAGRQINLACPMVDAKLEDGSRVHATIPPISPDGATLTIRRFNTRKLEPEDYIALGTMNQTIMDFLRLCVLGKLNIMVSGGTGSGKTTLLNMLSGFIPEKELIVTVEDNCELQLRQPNIRRLEAREATGEREAIDIQLLVKQTLRMRPDRIIVGEVRDGAVVDMFSAMSTGHEGSMSTIHADSPQALIGSRLPTLFSQYRGGSFSLDTQVYMTAEALNLIIQIAREPNGARRITQVTAVDGLDENHRIKLVDIFTYDRQGDTFHLVNLPPSSMVKRMGEKGIKVNTHALKSMERSVSA